MNETVRQHRRDALMQQLLTVMESAVSEDDRGPGPDEIAATGRAIAARLTAGWVQGAVIGGPVTDLAAHRQPSWRIPGRHGEQLAAATTGPSDRFTDRAFGIEVLRKAIDGETLITVTVVGDLAHDGDIVRVRWVTGDGAPAELLIMLYPAGQGVLTGQILTPALAGTSDDLDVTVARASDLTTAESEAVTDSVRCSPTLARNAWRRLARTLTVDHPIRLAVLDALR